MNINEYIRAVFNEKMQNFSISDYVADFRKYLNVYADNYGFEGNIDTFITDFNAEINSIKKVLVDEINIYIEVAMMGYLKNGMKILLYIKLFQKK